MHMKVHLRGKVYTYWFGSEGMHKLIWEHIMHIKVDLGGEHA